MSWFQSQQGQVQRGPGAPQFQPRNPAEITGAAGRGGYGNEFTPSWMLQGQPPPPGWFPPGQAPPPGAPPVGQYNTQQPPASEAPGAWGGRGGQTDTGPGAWGGANRRSFPNAYPPQAPPPQVPGYGRETGPPPGMSPEAWAQGEAYLNRINPGRQQGPSPGQSPEAWAQGEAYLDRINPGRRGLPRGPAELNAIGWGPSGQAPGGLTPLSQVGQVPTGGGMVQLRAPTGHTRSVPAAQAAFFLARGATRM